MSYNYDIFISYNHKDYKVVEIIYQALTNSGISCFFDNISVESPDFWTVLANGIKSCKIFLYLGSKNTIEAKVTPKELSFAIKYKEAKYIYPYFIDDIELPEEQELMLANINHRYMSRHPVNTGLVPDLQKILSFNPDPLFTIIEGDTYNVEIENVILPMIRVEGGLLELGATDEQKALAEPNEYPSFQVSLPTYSISQYPITQDIWELVMGYNKSHFKDPSCSRYPAENLTHDDAIEFVRRLSRLTHISFCLPSEEEWEYAARGGQKSHHYLFAGSDNLDEVAWYHDNSMRSTHPVGEKKPNELGLYDMCGNVWEWTSTPAHSYKSKDNIGGNVFIRRGGSWRHEDKNCRVSRRYPSDHTKKTSGLGLRVVIKENIR